MKTLVNYALSFVGVKYKWGGASPEEGYDCSGYLQEVLASVGMDPPGDQTADNLFNFFLIQGDELPAPQAGALAFFGKPASHCGFCIDSYRMVEATGSYVRLRPVYRNYRDIPITILMPRYMDE